MKKISIALEDSCCQVLIERGLLRKIGSQLSALLARPTARLFVLTNPEIQTLWGESLSESLATENLQFHLIATPAGERHKTLPTIEKLADKLVKLGADRSSVIVAFGGGVVGDVAGFLASCYMRGIEFVQVPTTFLAQVDSAVGGKTGVNLKAGKNLLGAIQQPRAVLIDPDVLQTLPEREFRAGLFESLKYGVIREARIFNYMEQYREKLLDRHPATLEHLITESVKVKAHIVTLDERESGLRRILNFGHTIGHALEVETGYGALLHGEAVAWGMIAAVHIALITGRIKPQHANHIISAVLAYAPLPPLAVSGERIVRRLRADKKNIGGLLHFVLPRRIGFVEVVTDVSSKMVVEAIDELRRLSEAQ